ncbi:MAG TPA: serine hydrolase domain-containing protein [Candidatus Binataceae bacterium]|nr:serine hydrolase domain-containing protein [Candidatus Binataceae bacterium]
MIFPLLTLLLTTISGHGQTARVGASRSGRGQRITLSQLRQEIAATIAAVQVPGAGVALVDREGVIWSGGVGVADAASGRAVTADTFFRVGSIEKSLIAAAIMQLQERGEIRLDDAASRLAPELGLENPWAAQAPVTVAELLEHTAGLRDCTPAQFFNFDTRGAALSAVEFYDRFPELRRSWWRPGEFFSYSNPGYVAAGYLIQKVSGLPYDEYLRRELLMPLGMNETADTLTPSIAARMAVGYVRAGHRAVAYQPVYPAAATALISSPAEMARFVRMLLDGGTLDGRKILSPESVAQMQTPHSSAMARAGEEFGYALGMGAELDRGRRVYNNEGGIEGYLSAYEYVPSAGVGYFFAINGQDAGAYRAMTALRRLLMDYLLQGLPEDSPPAARPALKLDGVERFTGRYELVTPGQAALPMLDAIYGAVSVYQHEGRLYQRSVGKPAQLLIPLAEGQFRLADEETPSIFFFAGAGGARMVQSEGAGYRRTTSAWPLIRLWLVRGALVVILTAPPAALLWLAAALFTGGLGRGYELVGLALAPAAGCLLVCNKIAASGGSRVAYFNARTLAFFVGGWASAMLSAGGFVLALIMLRVRASATSGRIYWTTVATTFALMTAYLASWGVIGYKFWVG